MLPLSPCATLAPTPYSYRAHDSAFVLLFCGWLIGSLVSGGVTAHFVLVGSSAFLRRAMQREPEGCDQTYATPTSPHRSLLHDHLIWDLTDTTPRRSALAD